MLLPLEFEGGTEYELQVRARPQASRDLYHGVWSEWSPALTLTATPQGKYTPCPGCFSARPRRCLMLASTFRNTVKPLEKSGRLAKPLGVTDRKDS